MSLVLIIVTVLAVAVFLAVILLAIGLFRRQRRGGDTTDISEGLPSPPPLESPEPPPNVGGSSGAV
jgi:hypothetical protein